MRRRIKLHDATLISIHPSKAIADVKVEKVLYGTAQGAEGNNTEGEVVITTKVMEVTGFEYRTFGASFYSLDAEPKEVDVSAFEYNLMVDRMYSPEDIIELRELT